MSYAAGPVHFTIDTYADWEITLTWYTNAAKTSTKNLTGYTARMAIQTQAERFYGTC